jgi:GR25 family glycosyltransferase involved in LPS biosynthesis
MQFETKIINLDTRPERWVQVLGEVKKLGINAFQRHGAVFDPLQGGERGCALSHYACLKGEGALLILEDDAKFKVGAKRIFALALAQIPEDFDLLYLGGNVKQEVTAYSDNLYQIRGGVHTTHAILYSAKGRKLMKDLWNPIFENRDPIDHWLATYGQRNMKCFICSPIIAFQRAGVSDVHWQKTFMDYTEEMKDNQAKYMR